MDAITPQYKLETGWTDARIERLKFLWSDGATGSRISADLGGISRSGVIGKVHRLGLPARKDIHRKPYRTAARSWGIRSTPSTEPVGKAIAPEDVTEVQADDLLIPEGQRKTLLRLGDKHCRWPVGEPGSSGFFFCGSPEASFASGHPYCPTHERRSKGRALNLTNEERERRSEQGRRNNFEIGGHR